jgi:Domain of unknown function (DUF4843)
MKYLVILLLGVSAAVGCRKASLIAYDAKNDIIFDNYSFSTYSGQNYTDSLWRSFAIQRASVLSDTLSVCIQTVGKLAPANRPYSLVIDTALSTAVAGTDYLLSPADSFFIPAGEAADTLKLVVFRTPALYQRSVCLVLRLQPNANFDTLMRAIDYTAVPVQYTTTLSVTIDNILPEPSFWGADTAALGRYSRKKLELLISLNGLPLNPIYLSYYSSSQILYLAIQMQAYLDEQQAIGNTILEDDGSVMVMGPDAQQ